MNFLKKIFGKKTNNSNNDYLVDRDVSWLKFNERVLEEANNKNNPLLERIRFLGISGNNLDEFQMVRFAGLNRLLLEKIPFETILKINNDEFLELLISRLKKIHKKQLLTWEILKKQLKKEKYYLHPYKDLKKKDRSWLKDYFLNEIQPLLTPISIFKNHPFPYIANKALVISVEIEKKNCL